MIAQRALPAVPLQQLREDFGLSRERMARLLDVSSKTVERWEAEFPARPNRHTLVRLAQLREIHELGLIVYRPDGLRVFLHTPMPVFDGSTALEFIERGQAEDVVGALAADYEGLGF